MRTVGRAGLLALLAGILLVVPASALSGSGENAPGQANKANAQAEPAKPAQAAEPVQPANAAKHLKAAESAESANAAKPANPAKAANAAKPAKASKPAEAAKPAKAAKPAPAKPAKAAKVAKPAASPGKSGEAQHHVIICHRTGSATNPYVVINVSVRAWLHGHQTHPALHGRVDQLLKDPATPGEKLSAGLCPGGANQAVRTSAEVTNGSLVLYPTSSTAGSVPATTIVNKPLVIVVHTTPNAPVTLEGAGVAGVTATVGNKQGIARLSVTPKKSGVLGVMVDNKLVKRIGVLGAQTSGNQLTG